MTTQNSPRKCVRKCGIAHLDFMVQYRGAVHAISVSPASLKVACTIFHGPISFQLFFHTSCHLMSQCPSDYPQQSSPFHACLEKCFLFNGIYIRLPNDGVFFSALLFLIVWSVQFDEPFIWGTSALKCVFSKESLRSSYGLLCS